MKRIKTCKFCGQGGFTWAGRPGDWRLVDASGVAHLCQKIPTDAKHEPDGDGETDGLDSLTKPELVRAAHDKFGPSAAKWLMRKGMTNEIIVAAIRSGNEPEAVPADEEGETVPTDGGLEEAIVKAIRPHLPKNPLDEPRVRAIARDVAETVVLEAMADSTKEVIVKTLEIPEGKNLGRQHKDFETLLKLVAARENVWLVGPAGGGKTTAADKAAEGLSLKFYPFSCGKMTTQSEIWGYMDANGRYVPGFLRKPFEEGGLALLDELDNANDNVITKMNASLSNGYATFPDAVVKKHPDCIIVAAGNTYGRGADALYIGRQQLDAATIDRFSFLTWDYDEAFERDLVLSQYPNAGEWVKYIQQVRKAVEASKVRHVVSPRASLKGAKLLDAGFKRPEVEAMVVWKGLGKDDVAKVRANLR